MTIIVRQARLPEAPLVTAVLHEAAEWLRLRGEPLWLEWELRPEDIAADTAAGLYHLAFADGGDVAGTLRYQLEDPEVWPDAPAGESAFVHRLAVRRCFAGGVASVPLLHWAVARTREIGRPYLRLDCDARRPKLRAFYEGLGFRYHSHRVVADFPLSRYELLVDGRP